MRRAMYLCNFHWNCFIWWDGGCGIRFNNVKFARNNSHMHMLWQIIHTRAEMKHCIFFNVEAAAAAAVIRAPLKAYTNTCTLHIYIYIGIVKDGLKFKLCAHILQSIYRPNRINTLKKSLTLLQWTNHRRVKVIWFFVLLSLFYRMHWTLHSQSVRYYLCELCIHAVRRIVWHDLIFCYSFFVFMTIKWKIIELDTVLQIVIFLFFHLYAVCPKLNLFFRILGGCTMHNVQCIRRLIWTISVSICFVFKLLRSKVSEWIMTRDSFGYSQWKNDWTFSLLTSCMWGARKPSKLEW